MSVPRPSRQPQQHGLRLIIEGVAQQNRRSAPPIRDLLEDVSTRLTRGSLRTHTFGRHSHALNNDIGKPQPDTGFCGAHGDVR